MGIECMLGWKMIMVAHNCREVPRLSMFKQDLDDIFDTWNRNYPFNMQVLLVSHCEKREDYDKLIKNVKFPCVMFEAKE
jgi:hypothetical protein